MKCRLLILTEIIAPYRIPVFNALAAREEVDLHVVFLSETDAGLRQWHVYLDEIQFSYEILKSFRRRIAGFNVLLTRGVSAAIERADPGVIVAGGYSYVAMWEAKRWARARGIPLLLWSESNSQDARRNLWPVEFAKRKFIQACQGYVVPGKSAAEYLASFGVGKEKISLAPNAVDVKRFATSAELARRDLRGRKRLGLPAQYFLYVGRFVKSKGIYDLLNAYAKLPDKIRYRVGLVFVGDGEERNELMRRSRDLRAGCIMFPGFVQRDELPDYYANAIALVFPTYSDPWGLVVNEAMACGIPVIATDAAGSIADMVCDGMNGYVVGAADADRLSQAMLKLVSDSELCRRMGQASAARSQCFTPQVWAEGVVRALRDFPGVHP
jgi:glycosyltransferase involved in cell wall biosynthesis